MGLVSGLREERLLFKDGEEGHGLLKHVNALLQIHAEVYISPVKTLPDILLLLKGEHVLVKELLQLLIDVVDADLLETVVVKDLEAGNVQDTDVGNLLHGGVTQGLVTFLHYDPKGTLIHSTSNTGHGVGSSLAGGTLLDPLSTDLHLGLAEVGDHPLGVNAEELSNLEGIGLVLDLGLLLLADGHEVLGHVAHVHHHRCVLEHVILLFTGESEDPM